MLESVAFIPDGNRRYAKNHNLTLAEAYLKGFNKAREAIEWSLNYPIREVTVWTISTENLQRDTLELEIFLKLLEAKLKELFVEPLVDDKKVHINIVGRLNLLPKNIQELAQKVMDKTIEYSQYTLNLCIGYGGRWELLDAINNLINKKLPVSEENLSKCLYLDIEPDLIIRTGNTQRLSGFLPWQSAYSELYFSEKLWPEFEKQDFITAVEDYNSRKRRFGR